MHATHWSSCRKQLADVQADFLFVQDTKTNYAGSVEAAAAVGKLGWASCFVPARIKQSGLSGGVALLWRKHLDVWALEDQCEVVPGRIAAVHARLPGAGLVVLYVVYLDTQGALMAPTLSTWRSSGRT